MVGEPLAIGDVTVTIEGARLDSEPRSSFDDPPDGIFLVVAFTFENNGREPLSPWGNISFQLFDGEDRTWDSEGLSIEDVAPGFTATLEVRWDVPVAASGFRLLVVHGGLFADFEAPEGFEPYEVALPMLGRRP